MMSFDYINPGGTNRLKTNHYAIPLLIYYFLTDTNVKVALSVCHAFTPKLLNGFK